MASQQSWQLGRKNEDFSKSVCSIDSGAILPPRLGQDVSRNVFVVFVFALSTNLYTEMCPGHAPENRDFHEI